MWLGFVAWLPLADSTAGETAVGELPLEVCIRMLDCEFETYKVKCKNLILK